MANLNFTHGRWINLDKPGGAVFFVGGGTVAYKGVGASNANDGLTPCRPLSTIASALSKCVAGRGDTVVLLPGSETVTAAIAITKDDVTLTGYTEVSPLQRPPSAIVCSSDINVVTVDADNVTIEHLLFDVNIATATADSEVIQIASTGNDTHTGTVIRNCFFDMEGADTDIDVIRVGLDANDIALQTLIEGCTFHDYDQDAINVTAASDEGRIVNCYFYDSVTANVGRSAIQMAGDNWVIEKPVIWSKNATATDGLIELSGTENIVISPRVWCNNANVIGILYADGAEATVLDAHIAGGDTGNVIDHTTDVDGQSHATGFMSTTAGAVAALINPSVGGTP